MVLGKDLSGFVRVSDHPNRTLGDKLLLPLIKWLESGVIRPTDVQEARSLNGLRQILANCCHESSAELLSPELYGLALKYLHDPTFGEFAERLLQIISESNLAHAALAAEQLNVLKGEGSLFQQVQNTALKIYRSGELPATTLSMMGAGLVGRSIGCALSAGLRGSRLGFWGRSLLSTGGAVVAEASIFHPLHQSALWTMGRNVEIFSGYMEHWGDSIGLMAALRFGGTASTLGRHAFHGTQLMNGVSMATRFRGLSLMTSKVAPVLGESGALMGLGFWNGEGTPNQIIANALGQMVEARLASALGHSLAPRAYHLQHRMHLETYQSLRQQVRNSLNGLSAKLPRRTNSRSNSSPWQWAAQEMGASARVGGSVGTKTKDNPLQGPVLSFSNSTAMAALNAETVKQPAPNPPSIFELKQAYAPPHAEEVSFTADRIHAVTGSGNDARNPLDAKFVTVETPWGPSATISHIGPRRGMRRMQGAPLNNQDNFAQGINQHGLWFIVCDGAGGEFGGEIASFTMVEKVRVFMAEDIPLEMAVEKAKFFVQEGYTTLAGYQLRPHPGSDTAIIRTVNIGDSNVTILRPQRPDNLIVGQTLSDSFPAYIDTFLRMHPGQRMAFKTADPEIYNELKAAVKMLPGKLTAPSDPSWLRWIEAHPLSHLVMKVAGPGMGARAFDPRLGTFIEQNSVTVASYEIQPGDVIMARSDGGETLTHLEFIEILDQMRLKEAILRSYLLVRDRQLLEWEIIQYGMNVRMNGTPFTRLSTATDSYLFVHPDTNEQWPLIFSRNSADGLLVPQYSVAADNVTLHSTRYDPNQIYPA